MSSDIEQEKKNLTKQQPTEIKLYFNNELPQIKKEV